MRIWKTSKRLLAMLLVCALLLPNIPMIPASASDAVLAPPASISRVVFANSTATGTGDGSSPENAFTSLESAFTALDDANGDAVIIVCGTVYVSESWNTDGAAHSHNNVYYITGKYGTYDYTTTAVIEYNNTARADLNYNGPTHYSNITLKSTGKNVMFYSAQGFEWGEGVNTVLASSGKFSVYGGLTHAHLIGVEAPYIKLSSGEIATIMASGDKASGDATPGLEYYGLGGVMHITIGGTARVTSNISTGYKALSGGCVLTVNGGNINTIYASGRAGTWINGNLTINLNAGTIASFEDKSDATNVTISGDITVNLKSDCVISGGSVTAWGSNTTCSGTKTLNLVGYTGTVPADAFASYNAVKVTGNSNATYASTVPGTTAITVDSGSTLTLSAHADATGLNITNNGTVNYSTGSEAATIPVVFVGDATHANYAQLPENATVYASLVEAYQGLAASGVSDAYIVLFSKTSISASFNTDGTETGWSGTYYVTGKYASGDVSYDFGSDAVIELSNAKSANFSPSGKQHFSNMKFEQSGAANINIYSSKGITIASTVTYENTANGKTVSIYGGEYAAAVTDTVINVYGGEWYSIRSGNSNSTVTNATINIDDNAVITGCIVSGGNKSTSAVTKAVINIEGGQVYQIYNSGLSCTMESLTINWLGGSTTLGLTKHSSGTTVGAMKLQLSGAVQLADGASLTLPETTGGELPKLELVDYIGDMPISASAVSKTTLSGISNVNYTGKDAATFVVNAGTTLNVVNYTQDEAAHVLSITNNGGTITYAGVAATYPDVVYVDGTGSGLKNGLAAENAVATLEEALALLDPAKGGTVVLCGELKINATTAFSDCGVTGQVVLTSVHDGVDYRSTNSAKLTWAANAVKFGGTGNMVLDNLVLHMDSVDEGTTVAANISQFLYSAGYMHVTESVKVNGKGRMKIFVADIGANANLDCEMLLEGGTFYQIFVGANTNPTGNATLTIDKSASVTSNVAMGGNSTNTVNGNSVFNMKGGFVNVIYDTPKKGTITGNVILNLTGGSIVEMRDYNGGTGVVINGNVIVTVGSGFSAGSGAFGAWASSVVTIGGKKILNLIDYSGVSLNSLDVYDVVNVFGGAIPDGFDTSVDATGKLLRVHDYKGLMGLDLSTFAKIKLTGTDSYMTFQGKVPTSAALVVDDGCTMLIRASANPGVALADYAITKLNNQTGEVILGEAAFVGSADLVLNVDFEDGTAADASGKGNNGTVTGTPVFVEGIDGGKAIYINNAFGKDNATQYVTFANLNGVDVSLEDYTVSFWYHTVNGGTTEWASGTYKTTAGADINMNNVKIGGVVLSNQDTVNDGSGISAVQLSHNQFFAIGVTNGSGKHYDKDAMRKPVDDTWHMITITVDRAGFYTIYVDGQQLAVKGISALNGEALGINSLVLGADINGKYGLENAYIDNLKVFSGVMNPIDVQAYYTIDSTNLLANEAESSVEVLGKSYESYKPEMTQTINTVKQTMAGVTVEAYADAANAYTQLKTAYENFLAAPQNNALLSALLLSDIHITSAGDTNAQRFEMVFKDLSEMGLTPDVFINTGDFSDDSSTAAYNSAFDVFEYLKEKYNMDMPMFLAQGNHENSYNSATDNYQATTPIYDRRLLENLSSYIASGKVTVDSENFDRNIAIDDWQYQVDYGYKDFSGNDVIHNANRGFSYSMTFHGEDGKPSYHFVILNTDNIEQTGSSKVELSTDGYDPAYNFVEPFRHGCKFLDDTVTWLDTQMAAYAEDGLPIFVVNHFPFIDSCPLSTYSTTVIDDNTIGMQDAEIRGVLSKYDDVFTFSGHVHHNLGIASILPVEDNTTGGSFTQVNMPAIKGAARAYENIPANWLMFVYEDEVVFRARDYSTGEWLTQFDEVVKLSTSDCNHADATYTANTDGCTHTVTYSCCDGSTETAAHAPVGDTNVCVCGTALEASVAPAEGETKYYATIETAVAALTGGETVTLLADCTIEGHLIISAVCTLDLNGKLLKCTSAYDYAIWVEADVLICDSSTEQTGKVQGESAIYAYSDKLTITGGTYEATYEYGNAISLDECSIEITGGKLIGNTAIQSFDSDVTVGGTAVLDAQLYAVDMGGSSIANKTLTITGGEFHGELALIIYEEANIFISGGTFYTDADGVTFYNNMYGEPADFGGISGGSFYGGIRVDSTAGGINGVLAAGCGFYVDGSLVIVADDVAELTGEPVEVKRILWGDANNDGKVDNDDAKLLKQYRAGLVDAGELNLAVCDLDGNRKVDAYDAYLIQIFAEGIISKFPAENAT